VTALRSLLENLVDYAGLFPPASLSMPEAVDNYARYRNSPESWMLGRFVVPYARLNECGATPVSVLIGNLDQLEGLPWTIDTIELKTDEIEAAMAQIPPHITPYFELTDASRILSLPAGARAKIRTGGITPEAFPAAPAIAQFISACAQHKVPFKATAGLHHPLRCHRPLTYSESGPSGWMFGFLNVFLAAALARKQAELKTLEELLMEESPACFEFNDDQIVWAGHVLTAKEIADTRRELAISFGSCSFEEPVADLKALGLL
jgi:hypothetical protein